MISSSVVGVLRKDLESLAGRSGIWCGRSEGESLKILLCLALYRVGDGVQMESWDLEWCNVLVP